MVAVNDIFENKYLNIMVLFER